MIVLCKLTKTSLNSPHSVGGFYGINTKNDKHGTNGVREGHTMQLIRVPAFTWGESQILLEAL
jgi:hypothetical protein